MGFYGNLWKKRNFTRELFKIFTTNTPNIVDIFIFYLNVDFIHIK
jgi:hypothetical protein